MHTRTEIKTPGEKLKEGKDGRKDGRKGERKKKKKV